MNIYLMKYLISHLYDPRYLYDPYSTNILITSFFVISYILKYIRVSIPGKCKAGFSAFNNHHS